MCFQRNKNNHLASTCMLGEDVMISGVRTRGKYIARVTDALPTVRRAEALLWTIFIIMFLTQYLDLAVDTQAAVNPIHSPVGLHLQIKSSRKFTRILLGLTLGRG